MASKTKGVPRLPDWDTIMAFNPQGIGGLPIPSSIYAFLKEIDQQQAFNRYIWYNLPDEIDGELIERILYFRGQGAFFYIKELERFFFLPYTLNGNIDIVGAYNGITPLPFLGEAESKDKDGNLNVFIPGLRKDVIKDVPMIDEDDETDKYIYDGAVLLHDRSIGISQITKPRSQLNETILQMMSELPALARTNAIANSGVTGWRVLNPDEESNVEAASAKVTANALCGKPWLAISGAQEFQDITSGGRTDGDQFYRDFVSLDNLRLSGYGLKNGGIFDKDNAYVNDMQASNVQQNVGLVYNDGLRQRQKFCDIVNSVWGLGIWCDTSDNITNTDEDGDGVISDEQDQSGIQGQQPQEVEE